MHYRVDADHRAFLRTGLVLLAGCVLGWMSPLVLFPGDLFTGGGPSLDAQYILKDIVLGAAGLVVAAKALGGRMVIHPASAR